MPDDLLLMLELLWMGLHVPDDLLSCVASPSCVAPREVNYGLVPISDLGSWVVDLVEGNDSWNQSRGSSIKIHFRSVYFDPWLGSNVQA